MEKYSEQSPDRKNYLMERVNRRWAQLHALEKEWGDRAYKFLLLTNAGGAIATLSFLGAKPEGLLIFYAKLALGMFMAGVVLTGVATAHRLHRSGQLLNKYRADSEKFFSDHLTWIDLYKMDEQRALAFNPWNFILPYSSFLAFILGIATGGFALFGSGMATAAVTVPPLIYEISLLQLAAAYVGVLASIFFGIGVVRQTANAMASLSMTVTGANIQVLAALARQKADYVFGTGLLFTAFSLQLFALVFPRIGIVTGLVAIYAAIVGLGITAVAFGLLTLLAKPLAARYDEPAKEAMKSRIAASGRSSTAPSNQAAQAAQAAPATTQPPRE